MNDYVIISILRNIDDPRMERTRLHNLVDILAISICSSMCGMTGWEEFEAFGEDKEAWFKQFLELPNGIPSHDTFRRVFARISPRQLQDALTEWVKTLNIFLEGKIVTIDAIGCQKKITETIVKKKKANYVLVLKKNQPDLHDEVNALFRIAEGGSAIPIDTWESLDKGHGRIEKRVCACVDASKLLDHAAKGWAKLNTVAKLVSTRESNGKVSETKRYFISSLPCDARTIGQAIREHWRIENTLHWSLDVVFDEDQIHIRKDNSPKNLAVIRRIAFSLAKERTPEKMTTKRAQLRSILNAKFAEAYFFKN